MLTKVTIVFTVAHPEGASVDEGIEARHWLVSEIQALGVPVVVSEDDTETRTDATSGLTVERAHVLSSETFATEDQPQ